MSDFYSALRVFSSLVVELSNKGVYFLTWANTVVNEQRT